MESVEIKIKNIIDHIRPYIMADGGDIEYVSFDDGIVSIMMSGACIGCGSLDLTVNEGIKQWLVDEVPEVKDVVVIPAAPNWDDFLI